MRLHLCLSGQVGTCTVSSITTMQEHRSISSRKALAARHHLLGQTGVVAGRFARQLVAPDAIPDPEEPLSPLVVAIVPGHAHLSDHAGTRLLQPRDELGHVIEIGAHPHQGHAHPLSIDTRIVGQPVELRAEGAGLHDLQPAPAHSPPA